VIEKPKEVPKPVAEIPKPVAEVKTEPKEEPKAEEVDDEKEKEMFSFTQAMIQMVDMMESHEALNSYWEDPQNTPQIETLENNYPKYFKTLKEVFVRKYEEIEQGKATKGETNA